MTQLPPHPAWPDQFIAATSNAAREMAPELTMALAATKGGGPFWGPGPAVVKE